MEKWGAGLNILKSFPVSLKTRIYLLEKLTNGIIMRKNKLSSLINLNRMQLYNEKMQKDLDM